MATQIPDTEIIYAFESGFRVDRIDPGLYVDALRPDSPIMQPWNDAELAAIIQMIGLGNIDASREALKQMYAFVQSGNTIYTGNGNGVQYRKDPDQAEASIYKLDGTLLFNPKDISPQATVAYGAVGSPDGKWIAMPVSREGNITTAYVVVDAQTGEINTTMSFRANPDKWGLSAIWAHDNGMYCTSSVLMSDGKSARGISFVGSDGHVEDVFIPTPEENTSGGMFIFQCGNKMFVSYLRSGSHVEKLYVADMDANRALTRGDFSEVDTSSFGGQLVFQDEMMHMLATIDGQQFVCLQVESEQGMKIVKIPFDQLNEKAVDPKTIQPITKDDIERYGLINQYSVAGKHLVVQYVDPWGASRVVVYDLANGNVEKPIVGLPDLYSLSHLNINPEGTEISLAIETNDSPIHGVIVDLQTMQAQQNADTINTAESDIEEERIWFPFENIQLPAIWQHPKGSKDMQGAAVSVHFYAGFGIKLVKPAYLPDDIELVRNGMHIVQLTGLPGDGTMGPGLRDAGRELGKLQAADAVVAGIEYFIQNHRLDPRMSILRGNSNGGLVALLAALRHPDKVGSVISSFPVVNPADFRNATYAQEYGPDSKPLILRQISALHNLHLLLQKENVALHHIFLVSSEKDPRTYAPSTRAFIAAIQQMVQDFPDILGGLQAHYLEIDEGTHGSSVLGIHPSSIIERYTYIYPLLMRLLFP